MSDLTKKDINKLIELYGFEEILLQFNLTPWKVLETLDDLGFIFLEHLVDE